MINIEDAVPVVRVGGIANEASGELGIDGEHRVVVRVYLRGNGNRSLISCDVEERLLQRKSDAVPLVAMGDCADGAANDSVLVGLLPNEPGKADALGPLLGLWSDVYRAVSSASTLRVIGYSMPADDIEIRTLIRAGVLRGSSDPTIEIQNPAPDVHARFRELILRNIESEYRPVSPIGA